MGGPRGGLLAGAGRSPQGSVKLLRSLLILFLICAMIEEKEVRRDAGVDQAAPLLLPR